MSAAMPKATAKQYWDLTKPRVVALIVFTALVGMFLAVQGLPDAVELRHGAFGLLGIWLAAASAAAINHVLDQRIDAIMARTHDRPLPTGGLRTMQAVVFAIALGMASMAILVFLVNPLCALLTFLSLIGYAIVYGVSDNHPNRVDLTSTRALLGYAPVDDGFRRAGPANPGDRTGA